LKSSIDDLRRRGFATQEDIESLRGKSQKNLLALLHADSAVVRTASAHNLSVTHGDQRLVTAELLKQLCDEKCLYTKMALCRCLEKGGMDTAKQMVCYLGEIGTNQHKQLPDRVFKKKSFPLPRDIIARSLGRMSPSVLPVLTDVLRSGDMVKILEALDAIGYMTYNNQQLAAGTNVQAVYDVMKKYPDNKLLQWKAIVCLSVYPSMETKEILEGFARQKDLLGEEAKRSISLINARV